MRASAIVLMLLLAACGRPGETDGAADSGNAVPPPADLPEAGATLALAASGPGGCSARYNGEAVTREQLLERGVVAIDRAIATVGGVQNITAEAIPVVRVEAPAGMGFSCVDAMLAAVQRAGFPRVILAPAGGGEAELAYFPLTEVGPPPAVVVRIGPGARMTWNEDAVDLARLTERARAMGGLDDMAAPPGELEIRRCGRRGSAMSRRRCCRPRCRRGRGRRCRRRRPRRRHLQTSPVDPHRRRGYRPPRSRAGGG
jgi:hypothetical protein